MQMMNYWMCIFGLVIAIGVVALIAIAVVRLTKR
jgi:hypothetical protein